MITYHPGKFGVLFAFSCKGSVFPKSVIWAIPSAVIAYIVNWLYIDGSPRENQALSMMGSFSFILGFLIVFKCQQSFARWWEGGTILKQMRGDWFNAYSCLLAFTNADPAKRDQVRHFQERLIRLFSLLYSCALEQVSTGQHLEFPIVDQSGMDLKGYEFLLRSSEKCEVTLQWMQRLVVQVESEGLLKIAPPILSRVFQQLGDGLVNLSNARKVKEFPIPFPLAQMVTVMLLMHWCATTFFCAVSLSSPLEASMIAFTNVFVVWCINYISSELEHPFGDDYNDLPLEEMMADFNASLAGLLHDGALIPPPFELDTHAPDVKESVRRKFDSLAEFLQYKSTEVVDVSIKGVITGDATAIKFSTETPAGRVSMIDEVLPDPKYQLGQEAPSSIASPFTEKRSPFQEGAVTPTVTFNPGSEADPSDSASHDGASVPLKGDVSPLAPVASKYRASNRTNFKGPSGQASQSQSTDLKAVASHRAPRGQSGNGLTPSPDANATASHRVDKSTE